MMEARKAPMPLASIDAAPHNPAGVRLHALAQNWLGPLIVVGAVFFNAGLALINAQGITLGSGPVIAMEVMLVGMAGAWSMLHFRAEMKPWLMLAMFVVAFGLVRMMALGDFNPKFIRDLVLPCAFVMLGITVSQRSAVRTVMALQIIILIGVLWEAASLDTFSSVLNPKEYYVATRGLALDEFTNADSDLYISATRPEERFFPFFGLHRLSSFFLEPVSLGNYVVTITAFIVAFWTRLSGGARTFLILSTIIMQFASDGRFSFASSMMVIGAACFVPEALRRVTPLFMLPLAVITIMLMSGMPQLQSTEDDLPGRIGWTLRMLQDMQIEDWIGMSDRFLAPSADSGIVYLIITQSVFGVALFWCVVSLQQGASRTFSRYRMGICLALAVGLLVSNAFVGIKTAAPMWFLFGAALVLRDEQRGANDAADA
ncbi:hypothetical protein [Hyphomicrobium sulfonivorans]|nr:hypothetical protein [Hyphomicrobium sulfonivorans]